MGKTRVGNAIKWAKLEDLYFNDFFEVFLTFRNLKLVSEGQIGCGHVLPTMGKDGHWWAMPLSGQNWKICT